MRQEEYLSLALNTVSARRQNSVSLQKKRQEEIANKLPLYQELERQFAKMGVQLAQTGEGQEQLLELESTMQELLTVAGYPADYLELQPHCTLCNDTGYVNNILCSCTLELVKKIRRDDMNNRSPLMLSTFNTFSLNYYPNEKDNDFNVVPKAHMSAVFELCKEYAENFKPNSDNLLFMGTAGLGKTHLALAIANSVLEKGFDVIYISAQNAFSQMEYEKFNARSEQLLPAMLSSDLLVLDDLGTEFLSPYIVSELYNIVNSRIAMQKATIYTTNLNAEHDIKIRYTEKIASRLLGSCRLIHFFGEDIRLQKNMEE